jgi:hypothetical protein
MGVASRSQRGSSEQEIVIRTFLIADGPRPSNPLGLVRRPTADQIRGGRLG